MLRKCHAIPASSHMAVAECLVKHKVKFTLSFMHYSPLIWAQILQRYKGLRDRSKFVSYLPLNWLGFQEYVWFVTWGVNVTSQFHPKSPPKKVTGVWCKINSINWHTVIRNLHFINYRHPQWVVTVWLFKHCCVQRSKKKFKNLIARRIFWLPEEGERECTSQKMLCFA